MVEPGFRPFRAVAVGNVYLADSNNERLTFTMGGAKLVAGAGAAATATLTDEDGTVLAELSAPAAGADWLDIPVMAVGKVRVNALVGAGAIVMVYIK